MHNTQHPLRHNLQELLDSLCLGVLSQLQGPGWLLALPSLVFKVSSRWTQDVLNKISFDLRHCLLPDWSPAVVSIIVLPISRLRSLRAYHGPVYTTNFHSLLMLKTDAEGCLLPPSQ